MKAPLAIFFAIATFTLCFSPVAIIQTAKSTSDRLTPQPSISFQSDSQKSENHVMIVNTGKKFQSILGFGGALTEASAYVFQNMNSAIQQEILEAYYSPQGLNYTMGRIHMNSCDFSLDSYSCNDEKNDFELTHFNINRDKKYVIPLVKRVLSLSKSYGKTLKMYYSPWSPPAWMKRNGNMNSSWVPGIINSSDIYQSWALHYSKFADAYRQEGIEFWGVTVQNEPEAIQTFEVCIDMLIVITIIITSLVSIHLN